MIDLHRETTHAAGATSGGSLPPLVVTGLVTLLLHGCTANAGQVSEAASLQSSTLGPAETRELSRSDELQVMRSMVSLAEGVNLIGDVQADNGNLVQFSGSRAGRNHLQRDREGAQSVGADSRSRWATSGRGLPVHHRSGSS